LYISVQLYGLLRQNGQNSGLTRESAKAMRIYRLNRGV
jgi:hypothetical protein